MRNVGSRSAGAFKAGLAEREPAARHTSVVFAQERVCGAPGNWPAPPVERAADKVRLDPQAISIRRQFPFHKYI